MRLWRNRGRRSLGRLFADIPLATTEGLAAADAIIIGTPTRFGNMCAQMRNFLDQTGGLWMKVGWSEISARYLPRPGPNKAVRRQLSPAFSRRFCITVC
jgi:hypothetical protein